MNTDDKPHADTGLWRYTKRVTLLLLAVWGALTFGVVYFAPDLDFSFFGWPFAFWMDAQGAMLIYVLIVVVYAWAINRRERQASAR